MIALKHALPLVRGAQGTSVAFEKGWLRVALQNAASKAGYQGWWLVDDLAAGIVLYLRNCYVKNVIDLAELERVVRNALRDTGYEEVASCFRAVSLPCGISLVQCLQNNSSSSRAAFFAALSESIESLCHGEVNHLHFYGLYACVDQLRGNENADHGPASESLRATIVNFVRERVQRLGGQQMVWCSIT